MKAPSPETSFRRQGLYLVALLGALATGTAQAQPVLVSQTVSEYAYNADGALVSVKVTESGQPSTTTTLTFDNYTPGTGTVQAGNGNLVQVQSLEGSRSFAFDARDRLIEAEAGGQTTHYTYDPVSMMAVSTLEDGPSYRFYYDQRQNAQAVNILQTRSAWGASETASARLGFARYLSDGEEQLTVRHRKDTEALYTPNQASLQKYNYDPYGASAAATPTPGTASYDLHDNPFRYGGEYTDPFWGGQYLRARWYDPSLPSFLSRDPVANTSRYGYGDGNPVMRLDPSGQRSVFFSAVWSSLREQFVTGFMTIPVTEGLIGHGTGYFDSAQNDLQFASALVFVLSAGTASSFFEGSLIRGFSTRSANVVLAASVVDMVSQGVGGGSHMRRGWRAEVGGILGGVLAGAAFEVSARLLQGSLTVGVGWRPFRGAAAQLHSLDFNGILNEALTLEPGQSMVYVERYTAFRLLNFESVTVDESVQPFHSRVIGFTKTDDDDLIVRRSEVDKWHGLTLSEVKLEGDVANQRTMYDLTFGDDSGGSRFRRVGRFDNQDQVRNAFHSNPQDRPVSPNSFLMDHNDLPESGKRWYRLTGRNCHLHARAVLLLLGTPDN